MIRTHYNGDLRINHVGQRVHLVGWVSKKRNLGSLLFIDLRDRTGIVQVFCDETLSIPDIRSEFLIEVKGVIRKKEVANPSLLTGAIEVVAQEIQVINRSETPALIIDQQTDALEETRLNFRYLDLRRPPMQSNLMVRSQVISKVMKFFDAHGFIYIETPILTLSTPGGARDYLVPSRGQPGHFYALPQSPQIYKQLLMISGFDRYFQIARCFRDEDLRADRQPDFTQIDVEASFLNQHELLSIIEQFVSEVFLTTRQVTIPLPLKSLTYEVAMERYGTDKPDTRFGLELLPVELLIPSFQQAGLDVSFSYGIVIPASAQSFSRKITDELSLITKKYQIKNPIVFKVENQKLTGSFIKFLTDEQQLQLIQKLSLKDNDVVVVSGSHSKKLLLQGLGAVRLWLGHFFKLIDPNRFDVLWVKEFPLFEKNTEGQLVSSHHPFTRPREEDVHLLDTAPEKVIALAHDLVINGYEAGGGSMRIYDKTMQEKIFTLLGLSDEEIKRKFGWFIDAFNYGTPPHGGIALGLDRLIMLLTGNTNIRDVIAFPKNLAGVGPLEKTPSKVDDQQLEDLSIQIKGKVL
jgi:aspartyl-tRNA synthetase